MKKILAPFFALIFALWTCVLPASAMLTVSELTGFNADAGAPPPTYQYCGHTIITTNTTSYSFAAHSICTAAADRVVLVAVKRFRAAGTVDINAPTIGGNAMTLVSGSSTGCGTAATCVVWYQRAEASGTTATIAFTTTCHLRIRFKHGGKRGHRYRHGLQPAACKLIGRGGLRGLLLELGDHGHMDRGDGGL
jgi:hypothetical protein